MKTVKDEHGMWWYESSRKLLGCAVFIGPFGSAEDAEQALTKEVDQVENEGGIVVEEKWRNRLLEYAQATKEESIDEEILNGNGRNMPRGILNGPREVKGAS